VFAELRVLLTDPAPNHALHHERGVHAYNYGDIALWDMVFGTFKDPET
jgi:sterol desaturase/sphingolipid hydroxylase (fatty acid hydroxylase superfamily)